ncbi:MAG: TonB-dependent receptor [Candidatus Solibacter sp.]|nr:TonB-dependent receptor [Candidatus Solibacter sp.]
MKTLTVMACFFASLAFSQVNTSRLDGTVTDPTGASVPGAEVTVSNVATGQTIKTTTGDRGDWALTSMAAAQYKVVVSKPGFKSGLAGSVVVSAGVPATVNIKLEIGAASETVEVVGGAEIVQATSAAVSSTIGGRQLFELPFATRNAVELLVTQAGVQTPSNPRSSSVNGLPRGALNVSIDGMNTQDNLLKSSDGFFSYIYPSVDALDELTVSSSAGGADSSGQGAAQIKFTTKSGSNQFHGGAFLQKRQTGWNANYYFNNRDGLPRDVIKLTQRGLHGGGPIKKDKAFFFANYEQYKLPGTKSYSRVIMTPDAQAGNYTYCPTTSTTAACIGNRGLLKRVNLLQLAGANGYASTVDPILSKTYADIAATSSKGSLFPRESASSDFSRLDLNYQPEGYQMRHFFTTRLDYNITNNHHFSLVYNFNKYLSDPDFLNNVVAAFPGTGTVLGTDVQGGQLSNRFAGTISLRSQFGSRVTNEWRGGLDGGTVLFRHQIASPSLFSAWRGYVPTFGYGLAGVTTTNNSSRRNSPVTDIADNLYVVHGSHQFAFGGTFTSVNSWQQTVSTSVMPRITFGLATNDPINTGTTSIFTAANLTGASTTQLSDAGAMYAALTGRVSSITRALALDEKTHQYGYVPIVDRNRMLEYGGYVQDTWRAKSNLTINFGLRMEKQGAFENRNGTYSRVGLEGLYGLSGVGNLFKPGTLGGSIPTFKQVTGDAYAMPIQWAPSVGLAWQVPKMAGFLGKVFGNKESGSVLRAGYAISTVREGQNIFISVWGSNQGISQTTTVDPSNTPADFGAPGSVLFRQSALPVKSGVQSAPAYPFAASSSTSVNDFAPNLSLGYVQSWNIGWQREIGHNTVVEARFTGNHGVHLWRQYDLNEVNIVESGFRSDFLVAQNNLRIARGGDIAKNTNITNFGNTGLAGQQAIPILQTALGTSTDTTIASNLMLGQAGTAAAAIANNSTRMGNLTKAGYAANMFYVNPTVINQGAFIVTNDGSSFYDSLQVEVRRRMTKGMSIQGSYVFSKSLANGPTNSNTSSSQPNTLRNLSLDKVPSGFDLRHALKANYIYELPFGHGKRFFGTGGNPVIRKAVEGWELAGVIRIQSGLPFFLSSLATFNGNGSGIVLHNITSRELQDSVNIRKTTGTDGKGIVYYLPQSLVENTQAAYNTGGKTPADLDKSKPYISGAEAGQLGWRGYLYQNWNRFYDMSVVKRTRIGEGAKNVEFRATALNVFNVTNFGNGGAYSNIGASFGQVTGAYRDISGTVEPGGRILEFMLRLNF